MRRSALIAVAAALAGCGYPGEPLPPALKRPVRVVDLDAVQQGSKILIHFSVPRLTTEGLPIADNPDIDLRVGEMPSGGWSLAAWEKAAVPVPRSSIHIQDHAAEASVDAAAWSGKTEVIGVRINGPSGRNVGWSNLQNIAVVPALPIPAGLTAADAPDALRLEWHAAAPQFRIMRRDLETSEWRQIGISDHPFYIDSTIEYGKRYQYEVQSVEKTGDKGDKYAESALSQPFEFKPEDKFPPAMPAGLAAVPGSRSVELVWDRNAERDFASYRVYRDGMKIADGLASPSYSDRDVKPGAHYSYQVSAVDTAGNESTRTAPVESALP